MPKPHHPWTKMAAGQGGEAAWRVERVKIRGCRHANLIRPMQRRRSPPPVLVSRHSGNVHLLIQPYNLWVYNKRLLLGA